MVQGSSLGGFPGFFLILPCLFITSNGGKHVNFVIVWGGLLFDRVYFSYKEIEGDMTEIELLTRISELLYHIKVGVGVVAFIAGMILVNIVAAAKSR